MYLDLQQMSRIPSVSSRLDGFGDDYRGSNHIDDERHVDML